VDATISPLALTRQAHALVDHAPRVTLALVSPTALISMSACHQTAAVMPLQAAPTLLDLARAPTVLQAIPEMVPPAALS